ncbi:MAG: signal peptidase I [Desulfobacteraceae bacterium]|nr:signal peptidase I [Desulfobacteraceae bacterium]
MKAEAKKANHTLKGEKKGKLRENIEALFIAILLALFIRAFVVQAFKIPSGSMKNTLLVGDYILVNKFIYGVKIPFSNITVIPIKYPKRGDIIVFKYPEDPSKDFIKRVVAVGGDKIHIRDKKVYVNDKLQDSSFARFSESGKKPLRDFFGPATVPEGKLFVMGDNRDRSNDSRFWGYVDVGEVRGKAFMIYWSWNKEDFGVRWSRLGDMMH